MIEENNIQEPDGARSRMDPRKERIFYIGLLVLILLVIWLMKDFVLMNEEVFTKAEEYVFAGRSEPEVKARVKMEIRRYQTAPEPAQQVIALAHLLECYYYQLFTRRSGMKRYFDFIKIALLPSQRVQLKNKTGYTRQVGRYLKRKKNLNIRFLKYELSIPRFSPESGLAINPVDSPPGHQVETVRVLVKRTMKSVSGSGIEIFQYHFRKHSDKRYYLYFSDAIPGNTRYRLIDPVSGPTINPVKEKREK